MGAVELKGARYGARRRSIRKRSPDGDKQGRWVWDMGSSKKSCSKGILESYGLPGAKRIFAMEY